MSGAVKQMLLDVRQRVEREMAAGEAGGAVVAATTPFLALSSLSVLGHILALSNDLYHTLGMHASDLFSLQIWRLLTAPFIGRNVLVVCWTLASLHWGVNLVRQNNSVAGLLRLFAIVQLCVPLLVSLLAVLSFVLFGHTDLLYSAPMGGMAPVNTAILVLVKQFLPDSILVTTPVGRVKYTHVPSVGVAVAAVLALVGLVRTVVAIQVLVSVQVAWSYLRFVQPHEEDAVKGDSSEHFTWASLFPSRMHPLCQAFGTAVFRSLVKAGLCKRQVRHVDLHEMQSVGVLSVEASQQSRDADRRRQKALRSLNERLAQKSEWPEEEEEEKEEEEKEQPPLA